jgi:hypothetical protein
MGVLDDECAGQAQAMLASGSTSDSPSVSPKCRRGMSVTGQMLLRRSGPAGLFQLVDVSNPKLMLRGLEWIGTAMAGYAAEFLGFAEYLPLLASLAGPTMLTLVSVVAAVVVVTQAAALVNSHNVVLDRVYVPKEQFKVSNDNYHDGDEDEDDEEKCDPGAEASPDSPICGGVDCPMGSDGWCTTVRVVSPILMTTTDASI